MHCDEATAQVMRNWTGNSYFEDDQCLAPPVIGEGTEPRFDHYGGVLGTVDWLPRPVSLVAYDVLWHERYGDRTKPHVLSCESPGSSAAERRKFEDRAHAELRQVGYSPGSGWADDLAQALDVLAQPMDEFNLRWDSKAPLRALAARRDDRYVVAVFVSPTPALRAGEREPVLWLGRGTPGALATDLVSFLPRWPPATTRSQNVTLRALVDATDNARWHPERLRDQPFTCLQSALRATGEPPEASAVFARLASTPAKGRGELGVAVLSRGGRRLASRRKIVVNDTEAGRYLLTTQDRHVTVRGGGFPELAQELHREHAELMRRAWENRS